MLKNKRRQNFDLHNFAKGKLSTLVPEILQNASETFSPVCSPCLRRHFIESILVMERTIIQARNQDASDTR